MLLHNTGIQQGRDLDEQLAAVVTFRGHRIARLDTYLSNVPMMEAFFRLVPPPRAKEKRI